MADRKEIDRKIWDASDAFYEKLDDIKNQLHATDEEMFAALNGWDLGVDGYKEWIEEGGR